jgi:alkylation response protein AidB-like acyl-CoA dehydrogenase
VDFSLSDEQIEYQKLVRNFALKEVLPHVAECDRDEKPYPSHITKKMGELGLLGGVIPTEYGGAELDFTTLVVGIEEMSRVCVTMGSSMGRASGLVGSSILKYGTEEQRRKYLIPMTKGEIIGGAGVTEPHSGTDVPAMKTTAKRVGDKYILNGSKIWISGIGSARWYLTFAVTDKSKGKKGITAFIVDVDSPGFSTKLITNKFGFRSSQVGELVFEDCEVPVSNRVGEEGEGLKVAMAAVENGRLVVASRALGLAQACLDESVQYAKERIVFDQPIGNYQLVQSKIADMAVGVEGARFLTYRLAWLRNKGVTRARKEAGMAKMYAADVAMRSATDAMQIFGAYSCSDEYNVGRYMRNAKILQIVEGNNDLQRALIAEYELGIRSDKHKN